MPSGVTADNGLDRAPGGRPVATAEADERTSAAGAPIAKRASSSDQRDRVEDVDDDRHRGERDHDTHERQVAEAAALRHDQIAR